jgi:hypothetical protein
MTRWLTLFAILCLATACSLAEREPTAGAAPDLPELQQRIARFAPTDMRVDLSGLSDADRQALVKLIEAARVMDDIFLTQLWSENQALYAELKKDTSPLGRARLRYFWINKSPWDSLAENEAFLADVPSKKLPGANFYSEDMTKEEFDSWAASLSAEDQKSARGFFTVVRRGSEGKLSLVPYSQEYAEALKRAANLLREAAELTENATLKRFLTARADAFLSNDYYASDIAWMDLDAPLDVTIGPYETYSDGLFGYKAAFEAYINLRDDEETARLGVFSRYLQEIEDNLPIDPKYRNPKIGALAPIRVVNEVYGGGDGNYGVQTAAYNLPNDERVVREKGSKKVMLKNVQEAKFQKVLVPISRRVLSRSAQAEVDFDSFFTHILSHELVHGLGPHNITVDGRETTVRHELKEIYSAIEEAKADITGLFALQYLLDKGKMPGVSKDEVEASKRRLYTTFLASSFRSMRFGIDAAHGRGMALQMSYLLDKGARPADPGSYRRLRRRQEDARGAGRSSPPGGRRHGTAGGYPHRHRAHLRYRQRSGTGPGSVLRAKKSNSHLVRA